MANANTPSNVHPIANAVRSTLGDEPTSPTGPEIPYPGFGAYLFTSGEDEDYDNGSASFGPDSEPEAEAALPTGSPCALYDAKAVFRVLSVQRTLNEGMKVHNRAELFHGERHYSVDWLTQHVDTAISRHALVEVVPAASVREANGVIRIQRLRLINQPRAQVNLFATIPPTWVSDRGLVTRAMGLWDALPRSLGLLVNALLWNGDRFYRYVRGPSSLADHHPEWGGNFRHCVEVAEIAQRLGQGSDMAQVPLLIVGGLIHDAAKAAEYRYDPLCRVFRLSDSGELVGHRDTLIGWLAEARRTHGIVIGDGAFLGLMHMLFAAKGAPAWLGMREPRTREADILSQADQFSRSEYLRRACAPAGNKPGFGRFHPNLRHRTYVPPVVLG